MQTTILRKQARQQKGVRGTLNPRKRIAGLGEILWDVFPDGPRFGGAPANFACMAAALSKPFADVFMVGAVGKDDLGQRAISSLVSHDVDVTQVRSADEVTGTVTVHLDSQGKPTYEFAADTAWDNFVCDNAWTDIARSLDLVCFGTLAQRSDRSRDAIQTFVAATSSSAVRIFDINLGPPFYTTETILRSLELANVLKLNDEELPILMQLCGIHGDLHDALGQLQTRYGLQCIAFTRGSDGAVLLRGSELDESVGIPTEVVDTVGAGDAFTAALAMGLLSDEPLHTINRRASRLASYVCSQAGATPQIPEDLRP
ncbi:MAG: carbohydrate kinase [Pseudomonadales bacterium]|nr:carbohydrate kinase [Pseudomonadales bacterium]